MLIKDIRFESKALRDAPSKSNHCVACADEGKDADWPPGMVVLAHLPIAGAADAGMGRKCSDFWAADLCPDHHTYADSEEGRKDIYWRVRMVYQTLQRRFHGGTVICKH